MPGHEGLWRNGCYSSMANIECLYWMIFRDSMWVVNMNYKSCRQALAAVYGGGKDRAEIARCVCLFIVTRFCLLWNMLPHYSYFPLILVISCVSFKWILMYSTAHTATCKGTLTKGVVRNYCISQIKKSLLQVQRLFPRATTQTWLFSYT